MIDMPTPYNTPGWLHVAAAASRTWSRNFFGTVSEKSGKLLRFETPLDRHLREVCAPMARQGVDMWVQRWYCPACGGRRPDGHLEGCEVVKQLGRV